MYEHSANRLATEPAGCNNCCIEVTWNRERALVSPLITRRDFHGLLLAAGSGMFIPTPAGAAPSSGSPFVHPGLLHSAVDLERMRSAVHARRQPIAAGFEKLRQHPLSSPNYVSHRFAGQIGRNPNINFGEFDADANAAYQCALMAAITGDSRYSAAARAIVHGWSASLQRVSGADAVLMACLGPFKLINAAEILRHLGELDAQGVASCAAMLERAILPAIIDFAPFANGNWDTAAVKTMLAIAVFCDDQGLFERALHYYLYGDGDGRLTHYIYDNGQCQESGRDQQHTQLGLGHMGDACQIAWNQGWDLYAAEDNRLLRGFEYTAGYNLGEKVEFRPDIDRTGQYRHRVISPPSALRPIYGQIFAHYHVRRGLPAPAVQKAVEKIRPEGAAHGADHPGFGTLLYACTADDPISALPAVLPAALHVAGDKNAIELDWLITRKNEPAILERDGVVEHVDPRSGFKRDGRLVSGELYTYRFSTASRARFTPEPASIVAGLPAGWTSGALGDPRVGGGAQFDGRVLKLCASGNGLMQPADEGQFVALPEAVSQITARFVPQTASQFVMFGLACRSGFLADAPAVSLLVLPGSGAGRWRGWHVRLIARDSSGVVSTLSDEPLTPPVVTYGRLVGSVWLRLASRRSLVEAAFSTDGATWNLAGQSNCPAGSRMGLIAASGIPEVASTVRFQILSR